jgi:acid phosphatase type 7
MKPTALLKTNSLILWLLLSLFSQLGAVFAIYGDSQTSDSVHAQVVAGIMEHKPEAVFHTGDLSSKGREQADYNNFFTIAKPIMDFCPFYPVKGNHEHSRELYHLNFPFLNGVSYYSVIHDSLQFIILDSTLDLEPGSEQYIWLEDVLSQEATLPRIALMHYPVFSSGYHGSDEDLALVLPALFAQYGVKALFSGHDHDYEHLEHNGVTYVVAGGAGGRLREEQNPCAYSLKFINTHCYLILERQGMSLSVTAYGLDSQILDSFLIPFTK